MTVGASPLRFGTRASRLARWQTRTIAAGLRGAHPGFECVEITIETAGDRDVTTPLPEIGGKGLFTEALEAALRSGDIDVAVHSLKDLPIESASDLTIAAVCLRADPRDVLVSREGWTLDTLPAGATLGTSSTRRIAQLKALRPDCRLVPLRGNVDTRVRKAMNGDYDAVCIAAAGVERLELTAFVSEYLPLDRMVPAPGQGALAVQVRAESGPVYDAVTALEDRATRAAVDAERGFLAALGGGCSAPVAAIAEATERGSLHLDGLVAAVDGSRVIRVRGEGALDAAVALGARLADEAMRQGATELIT